MNLFNVQHAYSAIKRVLLIGLGFFLLLSTTRVLGAAGETWHVQDVTYAEVRVHDVTPGTVTIFHSGGIQQLELADLPPDLQERFSYDPASAQEWEREKREERLAKGVQRTATRISKKKRDKKFDWLLRHNPNLYSPESVQILPEVDMRQRFIQNGLSTKHQGRRPSCSVFAIVSALEYQMSYRKKINQRLSEEYLIWATQQVRPGMAIDTGFNFREVIKALRRYGVPPSEMMPNTFGKKISSIIPSEEAREAAKPFRRVTPVLFSTDDSLLLRRIIGALNSGNPVIIGVHWPHWKTLRHTNLLSKQQPVRGYSHAVTLIGYRNKTGQPEDTTFIFRNSYGQSWGIGGCGFVSASYLEENLISVMYLDIP